MSKTTLEEYLDRREAVRYVAGVDHPLVTVSAYRTGWEDEVAGRRPRFVCTGVRVKVVLRQAPGRLAEGQEPPAPREVAHDWDLATARSRLAAIALEQYLTPSDAEYLRAHVSAALDRHGAAPAEPAAPRGWASVDDPAFGPAPFSQDPLASAPDPAREAS